MAQLVLENGRSTLEGGVLGGDDEGRDGRDIVVEAALVLEAGAEGAAVEVLAQARHDAAADVDAPQRAQCHGEVGGRGAEQTAEDLQCLGAQGVAVLQRALRDGRRLQRRGVHAVAVGEGAVDQFQAGAGDQAFVGDVVERLPRELQDVHLALVARAEVDVTAFGAERDPAFAGGDQPRHPEAGAGTQQADDARPARLAAADLAHIRLGQPRQRHRQRGEIVDDDQGVQAQPLAHLVDRKLPVVVGHAHPVALDGVGDRDGRVGDLLRPAFRPVQRLQVGPHRGVEVHVIGAAQRGHLRELARAGFQREAGKGAADVGEQAGAVETGHGRWRQRAGRKLDRRIIQQAGSAAAQPRGRRVLRREAVASLQSRGGQFAVRPPVTQVVEHGLSLSTLLPGASMYCRWHVVLLLSFARYFQPFCPCQHPSECLLVVPPCPSRRCARCRAEGFRSSGSA
mmetsp:Transcript_41418/g.97060  ORF Transcript_41418/g.97060 Transcript_41418/m.97060 type:complete len:454 (-) Transcript_41418:5149-6510(-)